MSNRRVEIPLEQLQATVKERLAARGAKGIRGLARKFKIMDDDGNKQLDKYEFSKALTEMGLVVNKLEFEELMRHYDAVRWGVGCFGEGGFGRGEGCWDFDVEPARGVWKRGGVLRL
jgi:hypothetical protein